MKNILIFLSTMLLTTGALAQSDNMLHLAQNGKTSYVITLASDAIPAERTAAEQLQKYLQQVTGAAFVIKSEHEVKADVPQILVGAGARVKVLLPQQDWNSLGADGIVIKTVGNDLILAGGRPRGTLYAVFQFLENSAGCRWWTPTENYIPRKSSFDIPAQNLVYIPPIDYREHFTTAVQVDPIFATIMRENGHYQRQSAEWGGHYNMLGFVHTFSKLLPPEKYFQEHPEWYSDPANGNKPCTADSKMPAAQDTQLNLFDPQVLDELTQQALAWIAKNPEAGYISISQNDNDNYCRTEASMKLIAEEGTAAAPLIKFVNKVAERIYEKYPHFMVETLAYKYSTKPPKTIRPAKNVLIRLAPYFVADYGHPLDSDWNEETRDYLLGWAAISPNLFMWNYVTNFKGNMLPHPNWKGLGADLRFFAANKVKGVFEQGDNYTGGVGDFVQLRTWLLGKLMWNPQLDQESLTKEFLRGYYGEAAPHLKQYLDLMEQSFLSQKRAMSTNNEDFTFITLDVANKAIQLFDQAETAVKGNPELLYRVQRTRLSMEIGVLYRYNALKKEATDENKKFLGPTDPNVALTNFIKSAESFGIKRWSESSTFSDYIPHLKGMFAPPVPLPDFAKGYPANDVIDLQPISFNLYMRGTLSDLEKDPAAAGGTAATIVGDTSQWAIQTNLHHSLDATGGSWHIYAMARVDVKAGSTPKRFAFQSGIYDVTNSAKISSASIPINTMREGQYVRVDLETHYLNSGMYIWFAPMNDPAIEKIYIDRVILIREK